MCDEELIDEEAAVARDHRSVPKCARHREDRAGGEEPPQLVELKKLSKPLQSAGQQEIGPDNDHREEDADQAFRQHRKTERKAEEPPEERPRPPRLGTLP